jgi:hypothetical protein
MRKDGKPDRRVENMGRWWGGQCSQCGRFTKNNFPITHYDHYAYCPGPYLAYEIGWCMRCNCWVLVNSSLGFEDWFPDYED